MHPDQQVFKSHGGKQAGLGWFSLGVGLVLLVAFRSFDGSGMTNSLAGFLLGLFLFLLGLAALFAHTKQTMVFDRCKQQIVIEEMTRKGTRKRIILFQEIAGSSMGYFGKPSNCVNFHFIRLHLRSGEQYILFAPGWFYDGCSNRQIMEARRQQLESWIKEGEIHSFCQTRADYAGCTRKSRYTIHPPG